MTALKKPKAVIFDWDDTVVDTWMIVYNALNIALRAHGHPGWTVDEAHKHMGPPAKTLFTQMFGEDKWKSVDDAYIGAYLDSIRGNIRVHDNAEDILKLLHGTDVYLAVLSSKRGPVLRADAGGIGFDKYFKKIVGAGDAPKDKPSAEAVAFTLDGSGIAPGPDVWFIGDSQTDLACAAMAGCTSILVETKTPLPEVLAKYPPAFRYATHRDMLAAFRGLFSG